MGAAPLPRDARQRGNREEPLREQPLAGPLRDAQPPARDVQADRLIALGDALVSANRAVESLEAAYPRRRH